MELKILSSSFEDRKSEVKVELKISPCTLGYAYYLFNKYDDNTYGGKMRIESTYNEMRREIEKKVISPLVKEYPILKNLNVKTLLGDYSFVTLKRGEGRLFSLGYDREHLLNINYLMVNLKSFGKRMSESDFFFDEYGNKLTIQESDKKRFEVFVVIHFYNLNGKKIGGIKACSNFIKAVAIN